MSVMRKARSNASAKSVVLPLPLPLLSPLPLAFCFSAKWLISAATWWWSANFKKSTMSRPARSRSNPKRHEKQSVWL
jgi:hypothetical protein